MVVDCLVIDIDLVIIGCIYQVIVVFDIIWVCGQGLQDQEFGDGEMDWFVFLGIGMLVWVE